MARLVRPHLYEEKVNVLKQSIADSSVSYSYADRKHLLEITVPSSVKRVEVGRVVRKQFPYRFKYAGVENLNDRKKISLVCSLKPITKA